MSVRTTAQGPDASSKLLERTRLQHVLTAGQEQKRAQTQTVTGGGPYFYVGQGERGCKEGVYCDREGKPAKGKTLGELRSPNPVNEVENYIRKILANPSRWTGNGLLMLFPGQYQDYEATPFKNAYGSYDVEQPAASQRAAAHATTLRGKAGAKLGTVTTLEGTPADVYTVVVQGYFVDGDGPLVGIGYCMRIYLMNQSGERLGTLFALGKRSIEQNDPGKNEMDYYLFVDLTEEWVVSTPPVKTAPAPAAVNISSPAVWDGPLHNAIEFAAYRSIDLLADQFTRS